MASAFIQRLNLAITNVDFASTRLPGEFFFFFSLRSTKVECRKRLIMRVYARFDARRRGKKTLNSCRDKRNCTKSGGEGGKERPRCGPGSALRDKTEQENLWGKDGGWGGVKGGRVSARVTV